jgi:geranylgeranyl pyrophosphate synthase
VSAPSFATVEAVVEAGGVETALVMARVEERMVELVADSGPELERYGRETISAGGKRLRPLLVCIAAGVPVATTDALVRAAVAVELVDLRRGRPTVVAKGGRLMALATGDLLFSRAFAELAAGGDNEPVRVLSDAASQLAQGELMQRRDAWQPDVTQARYLDRCRLKTGVLFRASCELGALAGGGPLHPLGQFGERIGVAFQLLDDVLDVTGPPERTGKPRGADLLDGTVTLPLIEARLRDPELAALDLRSVRTAARAAALCDRIDALGALEFAREYALGVVAAAKAELPMGLPEAQRSALELVADGVVERYS